MINHLPACLRLSELTLMVNEAIECSMDLHITKDRDPDVIPARLLEECPSEIAPSLCMMFTKPLSNKRNISCVHKKDPKELGSNYRPIFLLCLVDTVFERCIGKKQKKNVITP